MAYEIKEGLLNNALTLQRLRKIDLGTVLRSLVEEYQASAYSGCHFRADATNTFTTAVPTDQSTLNSFLNTFKTKLNAHYQLAGLVHCWAAYKHALSYGAPHIKADTTSTISTAAATDLGTVITLANACQTALNAHYRLAEPVHKWAGNSYSSRRGGAHLRADTTNTVSAADATDLASVHTLLNELKGDFNAHYITGEPLHRLDAGAYNSSRGAPHISPDTTNTESSADATDAASLYTLLNSMKAKMNAHCAKTSGTHHVADATNTVSSADADDEAKSVTLVNEIKSDLNAHMVDLAHGHWQADGRTATVTTADATNYATCYTLANILKVAYNSHIATGFIRAKETAVITSADSTDQASANTLANELKTDLNLHLASALLHYQADDQVDLVTTADATSEATSIALANALKTAWNLHCASYILFDKEAALDSTTIASDQATSNTLLNALKAAFNSHIIDRVSHWNADALTSAISEADASDLATSVALANVLKAALNAHFAAEIVKTTSDALISAADATDAASSQTLATAIKAGLNAHAVDVNLHLMADPQGLITTADATSLATALALAIACQTWYSTHIASDQVVTAEDLSEQLGE
jgi:hypothetical protein